MYLMDKQHEKEDNEKGRKRKALQDELVVAKKKKLELESVAKRLFDNADKRSKEAAKKSDGIFGKNLEISWKYHGIFLVRKSGNPVT